MEIVIGNELDLAHAIARKVADVLRTEPRPRIGLCTGKSPRLTYEILHGLHLDQQLSLKTATWIMLDEYLGISHEDARTFESELRATLFAGLASNTINLISPLSIQSTTAGSIEAFQAMLEANPVHLQLVGIGRNGHLAFNEPGSEFTSTARIVSLAESTLEDMVRDGWNPNELPRQAATQGLSNILSAREILLLAFGETKIDPVRRAFREPPTTSCPASVLQSHPNVTAFVTPEVARGLR